MQSCSALCALIQFPGMNQLCNLYKLGFFLIIFSRMKISKKFANNGTNVMNTESPVFKYLNHTLDTSPFVQILSTYFGVLICFVSALR